MDHVNGDKPARIPSDHNGHLISPTLTPVAELSPPPWNHEHNISEDGHLSQTPIVASKTPLGRNRSGSFPFRASGEASDADPQPNGQSHPRRQTTATATRSPKVLGGEVLKLSPSQLKELTSSPGSLPLRRTSDLPDFSGLGSPQLSARNPAPLEGQDVAVDGVENQRPEHANSTGTRRISRRDSDTSKSANRRPSEHGSNRRSSHETSGQRPSMSNRSSTAPFSARLREDDELDTPRILRPLAITSSRTLSTAIKDEHTAQLLDPPPSPPPADLPVPPFSMPTYLQLELSSERPSQLYIHRSHSADAIYESSRVKYERLLNFLLLPFHLEQVLVFGAFTCLDAWLYTFTILPLRFVNAVFLFITWTLSTSAKTTREGTSFIREGLGRMWARRQSTAAAAPLPTPPASTPSSRRPSVAANMNRRDSSAAEHSSTRPRRSTVRQHSTGRPKSFRLPTSAKADLLNGLLIIVSCMILLKFDASRMYHAIRGQAAIKLYVIYNVLEVCDRLFSALGQDILECLFCEDTLNWSPGSKTTLLRPIGLFLLALIYSVIHATALFYQVVTLNVAVNSYSNALLTLLLSNQFVEIKGTVFKKFERENLFQLTCADVVERFQLWLMLLVIALRNIVEVGGLSISLNTTFNNPPIVNTPNSTTPPLSNFTGSALSALNILPFSFTIVPSLLPIQVLAPFMIVLGSEMLVDWIKHAYITKFNATSPRIYDRFFDVLAKDYYTNAFSEQNLTRRLGLPVIPLACLFIRATLQTYHMFLATNIGPSSPAVMSTATSLSVDAAQPSSSTLPFFSQLDHLFRQALGRSSLGGGVSSLRWTWTLDDAIALITMLVFFLALYMVLLAFKLVLGMLLLSVARRRYKDYKKREHERATEIGTRRVGGWGTVEVDEHKRRWIYDDDPKALANLRSKDKSRDSAAAKGSGGALPAQKEGRSLESVNRYDMVAKRIW